MTSAHEPVLHALSVEPRVARPGETVCVIFRTRNLGTSASPAGTVTFLLGDGLEALDAPEAAVESVAPGDDVTAIMRARISAPLDDRTELAVQAVLRVPDAVLGTNVCAVLVRSRPVLDGAASGTFVEPVDAEHVRVRAVVTNEGDGAARAVRIEVPAPAGCIRAHDDAPSALAVDRLEVGASTTFSYEAKIVEPVAMVQADEGAVLHGGGQRTMLPVREAIVMEPVILAPCVDLRPARRSVDVSIDVGNAGWVDARDVPLRIALPAHLRAIDGSIAVDGVPVVLRGGKRTGGNPPFARLERSGGAHVVVLTVPARTSSRVTMAATFNGGYAGGTIVASAGRHEVEVPFEPDPVRDVRMRLIDIPRTVASKGELRVAADAVNAGDVPETLFFCVTGCGITMQPEAVARTIAPGTVAVVDLAVPVREDAPHAEPLLLSVVACDAERERARAEFAVIVRDRPMSSCDEPGPTNAEGLGAVVHAALRGPDEVFAGAAFTLHADIDVEDPVEVLTLRIPDIPGAAYVAGSTTLDGRALLDRARISPLAGDGLVLRGVPAGTRIAAAWTLLADAPACDDSLVAEATLDVDGSARPCESIAVHVRGRTAFAAQPTGLAYHIDACVVDARAEPVATEPIVESHEQPSAGAVVEFANESWLRPLDDAFTFALRLEPRRLDELATLLEAASGGLVTHILALRMFLPDDETSGQTGVASALDGVRFALRDVFDRLFVKLRIPGFAIVSDDVDDIVLRSAMIGLFERLIEASPGSDRSEGATVRIARERVRELLEAFAGTPYGSPAMLRALVALLPARCEGNPMLSAALARYGCALDDVLARFDGAPLELFDDALAHASDRDLDDARGALAAALRGCATYAALPC